MAETSEPLFALCIKVRSFKKRFKLSKNKIPPAELAELLTKKAGGAVPRGFIQSERLGVTVWFSEQSEANDLLQELKDSGELNGVEVTVMVNKKPQQRWLCPDSNFIRILGIAESTDEDVLRKHVEEQGLNWDDALKVLDLGGANPRRWTPMVDIECRSREVAEEWLRELRMTTLGGNNLWVSHRQKAEMDNGRRMPGWAVKMDKKMYLKTLSTLIRALSAEELAALDGVEVQIKESGDNKKSLAVTKGMLKDLENIKINEPEAKAPKKLNTKRDKKKKIKKKKAGK